MLTRILPITDYRLLITHATEKPPKNILAGKGDVQGVLLNHLYNIKTHKK